jgi:hypothetical protein
VQFLLDLLHRIILQVNQDEGRLLHLFRDEVGVAL